MNYSGFNGDLLADSNFQEDGFDSNFEQQDSVGFEKEQYETMDLFQLNPMVFDNFPYNQEKIKFFDVSQLQFIIVTQSNNVYRYRIEEDQGFQKFVLPKVKSEGNFIQGLAKIGRTSKKNEIEKVFLDPKGYHVIFSTLEGENFYFHYNEFEIRHLNKISGLVIRTVGYEQTSAHSTNDILIGTDDGQIYIWKIDLSQFQETLPVKQLDLKISDFKNIQIFQIKIVVLNQDKQGKLLVVFVTTNQAIFCFHGLSELGFLFEKYQNNRLQVKQSMVPMGTKINSLLDISYTKDKRPYSVIFTNGQIIQSYQFPPKEESYSDVKFMSFIRRQTPLKYAKKNNPNEKNAYQVFDMPVGIGISEYHYYLLHKDVITIMSSINEQVVTHYSLRNMGEVLGMVYDQKNQSYWIYSASDIQKLKIENENKDAWQLYLKKEDYAKAYEICKEYENEYTNYIGELYANSLFNQEKYDEVAQLYFDTGKSFEETFLKFTTNKKEKKDSMREGLERYLRLWLKKLMKQGGDNNHQQIMILAWIVELKVYKMNVVDRLMSQKFQENEHLFSKKPNQLTKDEQITKEKVLKDQKKQEEISNQFNDFLNKYVSNQGNKTKNEQEVLMEQVYQIMLSHGRIENCIEFAQKNGSYETIIQHYINDENYSVAIEYLDKLKGNAKKFEECLLKYCHIFMQYEPKRTIEVLTKSALFARDSTSFDFTKLIGGLMNIRPIERAQEGVQFLKHCIAKLDPNQKSFQIMNNILIFFLSNPLQIDKLNEHLERQEEEMKKNERFNFDLDFALRLFQRVPGTETAQISVYSMMGFYTEAVQLALEHDLIDLAKEKAKLPQNEEFKKKLQIKIAIHLLKKEGNNIKDVIVLTQDADSQIKIEDLLLHFDSKIKIEHFKDEICNSLKTYSSEIEQLKQDMELQAKTVEQLKNEQRMITNRCIELDSQHKCEECLNTIFSDPFYIFPCMHGFHKQCLLDKYRQSSVDQRMKSYLESLSEKIQDLYEKINKGKSKQQLHDAGFFSFANLRVFGAINDDENRSNISEMNLEVQNQLKQLNEEFDSILVSECIYCGPQMIDSIYRPFELDDISCSTWDLN